MCPWSWGPTTQLSARPKRHLAEGSLCALGPGDQEHSSVLVRVGSSTVGSPHNLRHGSTPPQRQSTQKLHLPLFSGYELSKTAQLYTHISTGPMATWEPPNQKPSIPV